MVRNFVKTFGRASGQWSVAEQPCHNTQALLVKVKKKWKATLCAEDPGAQLQEFGRSLDVRGDSKKNNRLAGGVERPSPHIRCAE